MKHWLRHPSLTLALSAALALASGSAAALGLGQIEVRSRAGQPLLAEIPIVSGDPTELEQLQARLASPETFARIGLRPPEGVVADLHFDITVNRAGRPVIRVTTDAPVEQPLLTFLVEVDWGQGRLVREYSALIDTPRAVEAPVQPPIEGAVASPPAVVQRPSTPSRQTPAPGQAPAGRAGAGTASTPGEYGPVKRGESLSRIASRLDLGDGYSLDQAMIALLRANPDAFIDGDINQLREGAVLRLPRPAEMAAVDAAQASELVRSRVQQWRQARAQAQAARAERAAAAASPAAATSAQAPSAGARLEIVPPAAGRARKAGTQSGTDAGGEGQMLRQELQQTRETLATRDAELQELKSRVAELEKLQSDQQKLLQMRDSELAAAQQRLAAAQKTQAATAQPAANPRDVAKASDESASALPWILGGLALLALLLGAWWARRRGDARPAFRAPSGPPGPSLADAFPLREPVATRESDLVPGNDPGAEPAVAAVDGAHAPVEAVHRGAPPAFEPPMDDDSVIDDATGTGAAAGIAVAGLGQPDVADGAAPLRPVPSGRAETVPGADDHGFHVASAQSGDDGQSAIADVPPHAPEVSTASLLIDEPAPAPVNERIELAQAYLDLGDQDSARQLLGEVVVTGDHASRQQALRMLRDLG